MTERIKPQVGKTYRHPRHGLVVVIHHRYDGFFEVSSLDTDKVVIVTARDLTEENNDAG